MLILRMNTLIQWYLMGLLLTYNRNVLRAISSTSKSSATVYITYKALSSLQMKISTAVKDSDVPKHIEEVVYIKSGFTKISKNF